MTDVTDSSAFSEGSLGIQAVLFIVTAGLYGLYWYYTINTQLAAGTDATFNPVTRTVLSLIPIVGLYWFWQFCTDAEAVADKSGGLLFVLFIVLAPISWYWIQSGINQTAAGA